MMERKKPKDKTVLDDMHCLVLSSNSSLSQGGSAMLISVLAKRPARRGCLGEAKFCIDFYV